MNGYIHAACFEDRVFHHALMNSAGPILETAMSPTSYACRPNMGVHKAVSKVQSNLRKYRYYAKIDINGYFAAIPHDLLLKVLLRRFKGDEITQQLHRCITCYGTDVDGNTEKKKGLPIGSLTSQYFANYFLDGLDRLLENNKAVRAHIRYMDDILWWGDNKQSVVDILREVRQWLECHQLQIKNTIQIQPSQQGVTYCGFRVSKGSIRLTRRKKRRFQERRHYWEQQYLKGEIDEYQLQQVYASVEAITAGTDSLQWRKKNLSRYPSLIV